jgi:hypothetical protein
MTDLSGRWTGVYFYPVDAEFNPYDDLPPTPFEAQIRDASGEVTGSTLEPDALGLPGAPRSRHGWRVIISTVSWSSPSSLTAAARPIPSTISAQYRRTGTASPDAG